MDQENKIKDLIIIGAGPAGLSASIYAARFFIDHLVIGNVLGGTMSKAHRVENYPGTESITGYELAQKMLKHTKNYGSQVKIEEVKQIKKDEKGVFNIYTNLSEMNKIGRAHV